MTPVDEDGNQEEGGGRAREADQRDAGVQEGEQDQAEESAEGDNPRCLPCPWNPTKEERLAHELTHWPYRPWCEWCVRGRAVGPNARSIPADKKTALIPKTHMDYAFLQDEVIEDKSEMGKEEAVKKVHDHHGYGGNPMRKCLVVCNSGERVRIGSVVAQEDS